MAGMATGRMHASKDAFEGFGILYYPVVSDRSRLDGIALDDEDMAWATTAAANLDGTGYALSVESVRVLAAYRHMSRAAADYAGLAGLADALAIDPLADVKDLVPDVTVAPMYPDFPEQVMEMDEATFRYNQMMHYASTYGVELVAGLLGFDVTVGEGWMPDVEATEKTERDEKLVADKVLHVVIARSDMRQVVEARLSRATRMHDAEIRVALDVLSDLGDGGEFPKVAFHENMMELIRVASEGTAAELEHVAAGLAQHPGDLVKATRHILDAYGSRHLQTRQKKGLCRAFEHFGAEQIARNIAEASKANRGITNFLSVARFGGPNLRRGVELFETGQVRSWNSEVESLWDKVADGGTGVWEALLAKYGERPGLLLRSLTRLAKGGCPLGMLADEVLSHAGAYSVPTLVRTLTLMTALDEGLHAGVERTFGGRGARPGSPDGTQRETYARLAPILLPALEAGLRELETPLRGKRVFVDRAGVSLDGSVVMPNDNGTTGTAWPAPGIAFDIPEDGRVRFFTFWDDRSKRVDVDLHFYGQNADGSGVHIGWNSAFSAQGMVTSGDITTSHDSVEYLDADVATAVASGVDFVCQDQHIYSGASDWGDIATCYSGATLVGSTDSKTELYSADNVLFRDDLTGTGRTMRYALIDFPNHYVRILRGADIPFVRTMFNLGAYLRLLFEAQGATVVDAPEDAELVVCVGRSDDPEAVSLFDEGFFVG